MAKKNNASHRFTKKQGLALVKLARKTISERLGRKLSGSDSDALEGLLKDDKFKDQCGTFVTLNIGGQLRGCIGNLTPVESIYDGVKRNAINAAFHDHRFPSLTMAELDAIDVEVSILTELVLLEYENGEELISKLKPNVDGVIIQKGASRATFLPQVWEQLPEPEEFMSHLCAKAGLANDTWQTTKMEVLTYQVQYFEEKK